LPNLNSLLKFTPPVIKEVRHSPANPTSSDNVKVEAVVFAPPRHTDDEVIEVFLNYSTDGKNFEKIEMLQDEEDKKIWRCEIPSQVSGTEVIYYIWARDTASNIATEVPYFVSNFPSEENLALAISDKNDSSNTTSDDLDIISGYAGFDENYIYLKFDVEGKVTPGTLQSTYAHIYAIGILNLDIEAKKILDKFDKEIPPEEVIKSLSKKEQETGLKKIYALIYLEHAKAMNYPPIALIHLENINSISLDNINSLLDTTSFEYFIKEGSLYAKIKQSAIGIPPLESIRILMATGVITSVDWSNPAGGVVDFSNYANIYFRFHKYRVE
jgi:hypothetical protein